MLLAAAPEWLPPFRCVDFRQADSERLGRLYAASRCQDVSISDPDDKADKQGGWHVESR